ncbi:MAG: hypothetical protein KF778_01805 [Rhodocyclaceae bacterium]|nr:hypothetical protein [Rhodocyclaceae bacterium]MBX3667109.1 hypothetical protein [Rhodocyclaceae bacterium]
MALFSMRPACPACGGSDVRRSHRKNGEEKGSFAFKVPFRCRDCRTRFFGVNRAKVLGVASLCTVLIGVTGAVRYLEMHLIDLELLGARIRTLFGMY